MCVLFVGSLRVLSFVGPAHTRIARPVNLVMKESPKSPDAVRKRFEGVVGCEPKHQTWAQSTAEDLLKRYRVARVAADPPRVPAFAEPAGWDGFVYLRLHGSPRVYWSGYTPEYLDRIATFLRATAGPPTWVIFDNTAAGQALENAWALHRRLFEA